MTGVSEGSDRFVELGGLRAHLVEWAPTDGSDETPVVLALHGLRSYARTWEQLAADLGPSYRVIALDHRGRGLSDWDPARSYWTQTYVADVEELVERLRLARFSLVGHSMGGTNALVYAARHPDRVDALVVEDIGPGSSAGGEGAERIKREIESTPRSFDNRNAAVDYWRSVRPDVTDEALESRVANTLHEVDARWTWRFDLEGIAACRLDPDPGRHVDLWPHVEALRCPTLVLRGGRSDFLPVATAEEMARRQPRIRVESIADAGHYVHDDAPDDYHRLVGEFLDQAVRW